MRDSLQRLVWSIEDQAIALAARSVPSLFRQHGGVRDPQLYIDKMIADLGPRRAAALSKRFVELKGSLKHGYGLKAHLAVEHLSIFRQLLMRGWLKLGGRNEG
jgi:hypothetical protein